MCGASPRAVLHTLFWAHPRDLEQRQQISNGCLQFRAFEVFVTLCIHRGRGLLPFSKATAGAHWRGMPMKHLRASRAQMTPSPGRQLPRKSGGNPNDSRNRNQVQKRGGPRFAGYPLVTLEVLRLPLKFARWHSVGAVWRRYKPQGFLLKLVHGAIARDTDDLGLDSFTTTSFWAHWREGIEGAAKKILSQRAPLGTSQMICTLQ